MMIRRLTVWTLLLLLFIASMPAGAADDSRQLEGEIVAIRQAVATQNQGEFERLTIRTRAGETRHLLLGETGSLPDGVGVGDRVRARVMSGDPAGEPQRVRSMRVRGRGERFEFRNESGELVRTRERLQVRSGSDPAQAQRTRRQDRRQEPAGPGVGHTGRGRAGRR